MKNDKNQNHDLEVTCMKSEQRCCQFLTFQETEVIFMNQRRLFLITFQLIVFLKNELINHNLAISCIIWYQLSTLFNITSTIGLIKNASLWTPVHIQTWLKNIWSTGNIQPLVYRRNDVAESPTVYMYIWRVNIVDFHCPSCVLFFFSLYIFYYYENEISL